MNQARHYGRRHDSATGEQPQWDKNDLKIPQTRSPISVLGNIRLPLFAAATKDSEESVIETLLKVKGTPALAALFGYGCEEHAVHSPDGQVLVVHRLLPQQILSKTKPRKGAVILWHGLGVSSQVWCCNTKASNNLAMVLTDAGYDVWMPNSRGNGYSTEHLHVSQDSDKFWRFSLDCMIEHDVPATVNYVLGVTGWSSLTYIGFSQGTTLAFGALSIHPELNHKINLFIALAPALCPTALSPLAQSLMRHPVSHVIFGNRSFMPFAKSVHQNVPAFIYTGIMEFMLYLLFRWSCTHFGTFSHRSALYNHLFSTSSITNFRHWFQILQDERFAHYRGFPRQPRPLLRPAHTAATDHHHHDVKYPTQQIATPIVLLAGSKDTISHRPSLMRNLPTHLTTWVEVEGYNHLDFLWAPDVAALCFEHVLEHMERVGDRQYRMEI